MSKFDQMAAKAQAEGHRCCGLWPTQHDPCVLEPPWEDPGTITDWDRFFAEISGDHQLQKEWKESYFTRKRRELRENYPLSLPSTGELPSDYRTIIMRPFADDDCTVQQAQQLLRCLLAIKKPVSFELIGVGTEPDYGNPKLIALVKEWMGRKDLPAHKRYPPDELIEDWEPAYTRTQFGVHESDMPLLVQQLNMLYPNAAVIDADTTGHVNVNADDDEGNFLALEFPYCFPIAILKRLDPDPLGVVIGAMDHLGKREWAVLQVLFQPAETNWGHTLESVVTNPYQTGRMSDKYLIPHLTDRILKDKFSSPLFVVSVRIASNLDSVRQQLIGWSRQFDTDRQRFMTIPDTRMVSGSLDYRCTWRPGMVLNVDELSSLVHIPSHNVASERFDRVLMRTKAAPEVPESGEKKGAVVLGDNIHRGQRKRVRVSLSLRQRHMYALGATGTGKSTLLLNMIVQDISAGFGVGVLDPHGDLIRQVLSYVPADRVDDVIYFNPADRDHPIGFNILEGSDRDERERIAGETVAAIHRFFSDSWGPRLDYILNHLLATAIKIKNPSLRDVNELIRNPLFRDRVVNQLRDRELRHWWETEFDDIPSSAFQTIHNKLAPFLRSHVRSIVCQRQSGLNFTDIVNRRGILLVNLNSAVMGTEVTNVIGTLLVNKLIGTVFRRATTPQKKRRPWFLYIDEFQRFMNLSVNFDVILSEARKFGLILTMANQILEQVPTQVRSSIFGNVGTFVSFRLQPADARLLAQEFDSFTADEILGLELGQALGRVETSKKSFNLATYPEPALPEKQFVNEIVRNTREWYSVPRKDLEDEFASEYPNASSPPPRSVKARKQESSEPLPDSPIDDPPVGGFDDFV